MKHFYRKLLSLCLLVMLLGCKTEPARPAVPAPDKAAGQVEWLNQKADIPGYQSGDQLFYIKHNPQDAGAAHVRRIDLKTGRDERACTDPYCMHNDEKCPFWIEPSPYRTIVVPVGERLVLIYGGGTGYPSISRKSHQAWVDIVNQDGTGRQRLITFQLGHTLAALPVGGMARDDRYVYFVLDQHPHSGFLRTLYRVDTVGAVVESVCDLPGEEEKIVGGWNDQVVLTYAPGSYQMVPADELELFVIRVDPETGNRVSLLRHKYLETGACWEKRYYLLTRDHRLCTYDLEDGRLLDEKELGLPRPENSYWRFNGVVDGIMTVSQRGLDNNWYAYGIDLKTGETTEMKWRYEYLDNREVSVAYGEITDLASTVLAATKQEYLICTGESNENPESVIKGVLGFMELHDAGHAAYGLVSKENFWNGSGKERPVKYIEDVPAEKRFHRARIPSFLIH